MTDMNVRPRTLLLTAIAVTLACSRGESKTGGPLQLGHYEIRAADLPKPFATSSSGNPPNVVKRPANANLLLPPGFAIEVWATGFDDPRNMILAPNGDVLVVDSNAGKVIGLRDANGDSRPDSRYTLLSGLHYPYGIAIRGSQLFIGAEDAVLRYDYTAGATAARNERTIYGLPGGGHATRNLILNRDGSKLYVSVGSRSNVNDETDDPRRAAITELNPDGTGAHPFATGLRNPVGLAWNPANNTLWTAVNERDGLGDDLVPDFVTEVKAGAFYGWPFSYIGQNPEPRRRGEHPELVRRAIPPSVLLTAHSAALGITFYDGKMFPEKYRGGAFVALHGSWNRTMRTGYKVIHVPFKNGQPAGGYDDFVIGWAPNPASREVWGRPAGVLVLRDGSLLIADDGAATIWRVTYRAK
jgi:glucose/arabinose dehydrogenase